MAKILLVEDDASLREIYSIRLTAEGFEIISAGNGEEALALAVREKPDLILSDVMMPKISGFDMLDILRSTPETKDVKVIMMTALSSEDQRARGEALGANRYLVKSQVGIEDVVNAVHEVLTTVSAQPATTPSGAQPDASAVQQTPQPSMQPEIPASQPEIPGQFVAQPQAPVQSPASVAPTMPTNPTMPTTPVAPTQTPVSQPTQPAQPTPVPPAAQPSTASIPPIPTFSSTGES